MTQKAILIPTCVATLSLYIRWDEYDLLIKRVHMLLEPEDPLDNEDTGCYRILVGNPGIGKSSARLAALI